MTNKKILIRGLYTGRYGYQYTDFSDTTRVMYRDDKSIFEQRHYNSHYSPEPWRILEISNPEFFTFYSQYFNPQDGESYIVINDEDIKLLLENDK